MKIFERLWPTRSARIARRAFTPSDSLGAPGLDLRGDPIEMEPQGSLDGSLASSLFSAATPKPLDLETLLEESESLPACSILLGACEDGLPFMLDLTNPAPGALLIVGDSGSGKTRLLKSILASAVRLNPAEQVAFCLLADDLDEYSALADSDHCQHALSTSAIAIGELIQELTQVVYERRRDRTQSPAIILAIDDLSSCLEFLDDMSYIRLSWLIRHGPRSRVWTIATLPSEKSGRVDPRFLLAFRTRLVGCIADGAKAVELSMDGSIRIKDLECGSQFYVPYGVDWLHLWICDSRAAGREGGDPP
jgi:hypothetical protein